MGVIDHAISNQEGIFIEEMLSSLADATRRNGEIWRAVYTKEDRIAKEIISKWMEQVGLETYEDSVGNLFGRIRGEKSSVILVGSHIDTVRNGGKYDGATGIATAIIALKKLLEEKGKPEKTIEVVALAEEEGSRYGFSYLGSKAITGKLRDEDLNAKDDNGIMLSEAMKEAGYDPVQYKDAIRDDLECFLELHIEQGPVLDEHGVEIGIVENIVGIITYEVVIIGFQNHAGTTPMKLRKDPVKITVQILNDLFKTLEGISESATLTIGKLQARPGVSNVIPKEVCFSADMRDGAMGNLKALEKHFLNKLEEVKKLGYEIYIEKQCNEMPIELNSNIIHIIEKCARDLNKEYLMMNSGAGHDAQIFADKIPTGMIFIPSKHGISHSPEEYTSIDALQSGFQVLKKVLEKLAWERHQS